MPRIRTNIAYKGLLIFSNYIIGFITFPYITRILGPENFGLVNFALNTVDYFLLFATLGITTIGTREIASIKIKSDSLNKVYSQIFGLNFWFTIITLIIYFIVIAYVYEFQKIKTLLYIGTAKILITVFAVDWFFTGMEKFRYITIRSMIIKTVYVILVFLFVNDTNDSKLYFGLTIGSVVVNSIVNFAYASKFVKLQFRDVISTKYLKQNVKLGIYVIMTSMYITFNVMFLGITTNNLEVGYYSTAVKLYFVILNLFSAYTSVMLPRMTTLISDDDTERFQFYIHTSLRLVFFIAIPLISSCMILSPQIIFVLSGSGYQESILPMRILMPAMIFVWISQVIVLQGLIPMGKDNILLRTSVIGALCALLLNFILTPKMGAVGSSIVLLACEIVVTGYYIYIVKLRSYMKLLPIKDVLKYIINSIPYIFIALGASYIENPFASLIVAFILTCFLFAYSGKRQLMAIISVR